MAVEDVSEGKYVCVCTLVWRVRTCVCMRVAGAEGQGGVILWMDGRPLRGVSACCDGDSRHPASLRVGLRVSARAGGESLLRQL